MGNIDVLIRQDGKIEPLGSYILVKGDMHGMTAHADATLQELAMATCIVYDLFIKEAMHYSDQDLYDACADAGIEYSTVRNLVMEARRNA